MTLSELPAAVWPSFPGRVRTELSESRLWALGMVHVKGELSQNHASLLGIGHLLSQEPGATWFEVLPELHVSSFPSPRTSARQQVGSVSPRPVF